jgi:hypothetical protein
MGVSKVVPYARSVLSTKTEGHRDAQRASQRKKVSHSLKICWKLLAFPEPWQPRLPEEEIGYNTGY